MIKLAGQKFVASCLNVYTVDKEDASNRNFMNEKPVVLCSFGNLDLVNHIEQLLKEYSDDLSRETIETDLETNFFTVMKKLAIKPEALAARKEWLIGNSRCCEVLESEFFYQVIPSLDFALFDIDQEWLKTR